MPEEPKAGRKSSPVKTILAPLIPGSEAQAIAWAARLAHDFGAGVDGLYVRHEERLAGALYGPSHNAHASPAAVAELLKAEREAEAAARAAFQTARDNTPGRPFGRFLVLGWTSQAAIEQAARCYDLVATVLPGDPASPPADELLIRLVLQAGAPVFATPPDLPADRPLDRVVLAWDASREAARALKAALPFLKRARQVQVVHLGLPGTDHDPVRASISYLEAHGVSADLKQSAAIDIGEGVALLELVESAGANLLVMGAFGHPRWIERAFGGATHEVTRRSRIPVLLAH